MQGKTKNWTVESLSFRTKRHQIFHRFDYIEREFGDLKLSILEVRSTNLLWDIANVKTRNKELGSYSSPSVVLRQILMEEKKPQCLHEVWPISEVVSVLRRLS